MWKKGDTADADKLPAFSLPVRPSAVLSHTSLIKPAPPPPPAVDASCLRTFGSGLPQSLQRLHPTRAGGRGRAEENVTARLWSSTRTILFFFKVEYFRLMLISILAGAGSCKEWRRRRRGDSPLHYSVLHDKYCQQLKRQDSFVKRTPSRICLLTVY